MTVLLWRGDPAGGWGLLASLTSSGAVDGYQSMVDSTIDLPVVDQQTYSYVLEAQIPPSSTNIRLAGVRVDFGYTSALPVISKP